MLLRSVTPAHRFRLTFCSLAAVATLTCMTLLYGWQPLHFIALPADLQHATFELSRRLPADFQFPLLQRYVAADQLPEYTPDMTYRCFNQTSQSILFLGNSIQREFVTIFGMVLNQWRYADSDEQKLRCGRGMRVGEDAVYAKKAGCTVSEHGESNSTSSIQHPDIPLQFSFLPPICTADGLTNQFILPTDAKSDYKDVDTIVYLSGAHFLLTNFENSTWRTKIDGELQCLHDSVHRFVHTKSAVTGRNKQFVYFTQTKICGDYAWEIPTKQWTPALEEVNRRMTDVVLSAGGSVMDMYSYTATNNTQYDCQHYPVHPDGRPETIHPVTIQPQLMNIWLNQHCNRPQSRQHLPYHHKFGDLVPL